MTALLEVVSPPAPIQIGVQIQKLATPKWDEIGKWNFSLEFTPPENNCSLFY